MNFNIVEEIVRKYKKVGKAKFGKKENYYFFDFECEPFSKEEMQKIENEVNSVGKFFIKIIGTSSSFDKETQKAMQRLMFLASESKEEVEAKYRELEELKKRDHRYLGTHMDLFHFEEELIGSGLPLFHPKGAFIRRKLIEFMRKVNDKLGCEEVWTPHIAKTELWKVSGHYTKYRDKMFIWEQDDEEFGIKPMNCPFHITIFNFRPRSYRELPMRFAEFATVYRKEQSGELHGLTRVWSITQDDHHFYVKPEDLKPEMKRIIAAVEEVYKKFGFPYRAVLSTRPEEFIGSIEIWNKAETIMKEVLDESGLDYEIEEGEGAFYGPKIDFIVKDCMAREWQLATIQLDFNLPERFDMRYMDKDGSLKRPIIIHFAILGSIERFIGILLEHFNGRLPTWLNPLPVALLPVADRHLEAAKKIAEKLNVPMLIMEEGTVQNRIRLAEEQKIPYICVIGDKEVANNTIAVRCAGKVEVMKQDEFVEKINEEARMP